MEGEKYLYSIIHKFYKHARRGYLVKVCGTRFAHNNNVKNLLSNSEDSSSNDSFQGRKCPRQGLGKNLC
jgi:hypothetical protein